MTDSVVLVGCGNMGFALLTGWLREVLRPTQIHVVEPAKTLRDRAATLGIKTYEGASNLPPDLPPRLIVLAVKPQVLMDVVASYRTFGGGRTTFLSIAAGVGSDRLRAALGEKTPIIRCMPNTPAAIGHGAIVCYRTAQVRAEDASFAERLLSASGQVFFVEDETLMDAVTAVSGSGPAYVFHFIECLAAAGRAAGLPEELAGRLALQTVNGAARLAAGSEIAPSELRQQVTSPGGTTAAALEVLMSSGRLKELVSEAVAAATARSQELGKA